MWIRGFSTVNLYTVSTIFLSNVCRACRHIIVFQMKSQSVDHGFVRIVKNQCMPMEQINDSGFFFYNHLCCRVVRMQLTHNYRNMPFKLPSTTPSFPVRTEWVFVNSNEISLWIWIYSKWNLSHLAMGL